MKAQKMEGLAADPIPPELQAQLRAEAGRLRESAARSGIGQGSKLIARDTVLIMSCVAFAGMKEKKPGVGLKLARLVYWVRAGEKPSTGWGKWPMKQRAKKKGIWTSLLIV